ncbi:hypothetical protein [Halosimplex pelagicum]|uniref:Uncharacterized protein n=1 Tax=Halosimplex pelagicum TaxID=869886 RepID=A0A7D5P5G8_9EURY|nr:hypothetical protein [Halosimplex pelagicum]QLH81263.1 hypothetical protein HZS54_06255 [Halosimplex pelagicum]
MQRKRVAYRAVALAVLIGCLGAAMIGFGSLDTHPDKGVPPGNDEVAAAYGDYLGQRVHVYGTVVSVDPLRIRGETVLNGPVELTVDGYEESAQKGDVLSVYGVLRPENTVEATEVVRKPGGSYWRTRLLSAIAGLWVLIRLLRHWRIDLLKLRARPRSFPIAFGTMFDSEEAERDA